MTVPVLVVMMVFMFVIMVMMVFMIMFVFMVMFVIMVVMVFMIMFVVMVVLVFMVVMMFMLVLVIVVVVKEHLFAFLNTVHLNAHVGTCDAAFYRRGGLKYYPGYAYAVQPIYEKSLFFFA